MQAIALLFASLYQPSRQRIGSSIDMCTKYPGKRLLIRLFSMSRKSSCVKGGKQHRYEAMNMFRKGQVQGVDKGDVRCQATLVARLFGVVA